MGKIQIKDEFFGDLLCYVKEDDITDILFNGRHVWIHSLTKGPIKTDTKITNDFVEILATRLSTLTDQPFNEKDYPILEADTDDLRISIVHKSKLSKGFSLAIRKTPAIRRLNDEKMIEEGYADQDIINLLGAFVKSKCSIIIGGEVGSGKTELIKYLVKFTPWWHRIFSIEDNFELRLSEIYPEKDIVEVKVDSWFTYVKAIIASLRQLVVWILMAEARGMEVLQLLMAAAAGCYVITTLHVTDARKIPDRVVEMCENENKRNSVYNHFDVGIIVDKEVSGRITRHISQIVIFDRNTETLENKCVVLYEDGEFLTNELTDKFMRKFKKAHIKNPLENVQVTKGGVN